MKHHPFPDIGQFRNVIRNVSNKTRYAGTDPNGDPIYDYSKPLPTLSFEGTVKLHGTNAAIALDKATGDVWFQSRERLLSLGQDNAGFMASFHGKPVAEFLSKIPGAGTVILYGEWCGSGIQRGVALTQLPKMFVVFAAKSETWLPKEIVATLKDTNLGIYNIYDAQTYSVNIDFNQPEMQQNILVENTASVEAECPFAKLYGVSGVGEGIVYRCITPGWEDPQFWMKIKGEKHSVSKVKTIAAIDTEAVKTLNDFVNNTVTEARCRQSLDKLKERGLPLERKSLGEFLRWIVTDIIKEESDVAVASGIDLAKIGGPISNHARTWFFKNENNF